jgi:hypothetical protein
VEFCILVLIPAPVSDGSGRKFHWRLMQAFICCWRHCHFSTFCVSAVEAYRLCAYCVRLLVLSIRRLARTLGTVRVCGLNLAWAAATNACCYAEPTTPEFSAVATTCWSLYLLLEPALVFLPDVFKTPCHLVLGFFLYLGTVIWSSVSITEYFHSLLHSVLFWEFCFFSGAASCLPPACICLDLLLLFGYVFRFVCLDSGFAVVVSCFCLLYGLWSAFLLSVIWLLDGTCLETYYVIFCLACLLHSEVGGMGGCCLEGGGDGMKATSACRKNFTVVAHFCCISSCSHSIPSMLLKPDTYFSYYVLYVTTVLVMHSLTRCVVPSMGESDLQEAHTTIHFIDWRCLFW